MTDDTPDPRHPALRAAAETLALPLDDAQAERLLRYLALLHRWNASYNLTAIRDPQDMLVQHLFDCLAVVTPLRRQLGAGGRRVLDVGSGGGLPGAVLAVMCPELDVWCVDTVGKKAAFVRQVAMELALPNLRAEHTRVENLKAVPFDAVTSRAFSSLADFVQLTRQHLASGAVWMAMKGKAPTAEISALPADVEVFHVEQLAVPGLDAERCLVWMKPQ